MRSNASILKSQVLYMWIFKAISLTPWGNEFVLLPVCMCWQVHHMKRNSDTTYDFLTHQLDDEGLAPRATFLSNLKVQWEDQLQQQQPQWHSKLSIFFNFLKIWHILGILQILHIWHINISFSDWGPIWGSSPLCVAELWSNALMPVHPKLATPSSASASREDSSHFVPDWLQNMQENMRENLKGNMALAIWQYAEFTHTPFPYAEHSDKNAE